MLALTPTEQLVEIARRARAARLRADLTQAGLAARAGVSTGSLRRFEQTGQIALESLVKIAFALRAERHLDALFTEPEFQTLDEALAEPAERKRGRRR